ncbi:hypothetical protein PBRA_006400 [Plasmodiophora brassicae]|uniref:Uncharacterized protein n=1 Tax=Plasmodiophora brassicae TaxID=37360 RepID=A0A0G4IT65_PLABS|nr:hypothetical protein PBRA_006400 [Plasmodiophora brassicae]
MNLEVKSSKAVSPQKAASRLQKFITKQQPLPVEEQVSKSASVFLQAPVLMQLSKLEKHLASQSQD